jgi:SAM-dependent methyltransferase
MLLYRAAFIAELARGKRVLDVGCVNHTLATRRPKYWVHGILRESAAHLVGLDYEKDEVESLRKEGFNVVCADATDFNLDEQFDLIVAGEIIEHLTAPGKLLDCAKRHLAPEGRLVLTCPNANNILYFIENCLFGHEQDNTDHTCLFTPTTMAVLLRKCGYRPVSFHFVAENLAYYKDSVHRKALAHVMWAMQAMAGVLRPSLCKNFITVAEPVKEPGKPASGAASVF